MGPFLFNLVILFKTLNLSELDVLINTYGRANHPTLQGFLEGCETVHVKRPVPGTQMFVKRVFTTRVN